MFYFDSSQVSNSLTGENTAILLRVLGERKEDRLGSWLAEFWFDFRKRIISLLGVSFRHYNCKFALSIIANSIYKKPIEGNLLFVQ